VREDSGKAGLSLDSDVTKVLYDLQGVMGAPSIVVAVKQAYQDVVSMIKLRVTHWPIYTDGSEEYTNEAMIEHLLSFIKWQEDESRADLKSLHEAEAEIESLKELAEERYEEGLEEGRDNHAIYVRCVHCNKPIQVTPLSEAHKILTQVLQEEGWGHSICVRRDEYRRSAGSRALDAVLRF